MMHECRTVKFLVRPAFMHNDNKDHSVLLCLYMGKNRHVRHGDTGVLKIDMCDTALLKIDGHEQIE